MRTPSISPHPLLPKNIIDPKDRIGKTKTVQILAGRRHINSFVYKPYDLCCTFHTYKIDDNKPTLFLFQDDS